MYIIMLIDTFSQKNDFTITGSAVISCFQRFLFQVAAASRSEVIDIFIDPRSLDQPAISLWGRSGVSRNENNTCVPFRHYSWKQPAAVRDGRLAALPHSAA